MRFRSSENRSQAPSCAHIPYYPGSSPVNRMVINRVNQPNSLLNSNSNEFEKRNLLSLQTDSSSNIIDVVDDLLELKYLIGNLKKVQNKIDQYTNESSWSSGSSYKVLENLKEKLQQHLETVERVSSWTNINDLERVLGKIRLDFLSMKATIREGFKINGALLSSRDWQSPIYSSSFLNHDPTNRLTENIKEHVLDYKRDGHLDAKEYELNFFQEYLNHLGSDKLVAYLTSSGMSAFSTTLHWLSGELGMKKAVAVSPMYFENIHLAEKFFANLIQINPQNTGRLIEKLNEIKPEIVMLDSVTNCGEVRKHDVEAVINWAKRAKHQVALVLDTTLSPATILPDNLLSDMPENVITVFVESLAKHYQFGMDAVTGGIIMVEGTEEIHKSFRPTRARFGANITDASAGSLPKPNRQRLTRRLKRHSRNMEIMADSLLHSINEESGIFQSLSWVQDGFLDISWYRSPVMSINLCPQFNSVWHYQEFERAVLELAKERNHPVAFSTSFGFDITRFYVTAPSTDFEPPFLRLSVGTETLYQLKSLIEIVSVASEKLAANWTMQDKLVPAKPVLIPDSKESESYTFESYDGVFDGKEGLKNYLNPENYAPSPLVELPDHLNPFSEDKVRVFAKFMPLVPLMNIKSLPAYSMLSEAAKRGDLDDVQNIIESSSSNTVMSLSVISRLFGIDTTSAIVDHSISSGLIKMLQLFGIEIYKHPSLGHELFGKIKPRRDRAQSMGSREGWFNPNQYGNPDNPLGFEKWLAPTLWKQAKGNLDVLSLGLGTCGTMVGVSKFLKKKNNSIEIVACCPQAGQAVPGPREESLLVDVTFNWKNVYDARIDLGCEESFEASLNLLRNGIMAGPSSGMNYAGLMSHLNHLKSSGKLESMRNKEGEVSAAFLCCDSPLQHINDYFVVLGESRFPQVHEVPAKEDLI